MALLSYHIFPVNHQTPGVESHAITQSYGKAKRQAMTQSRKMTTYIEFNYLVYPDNIILLSKGLLQTRTGIIDSLRLKITRYY